MHVLNQLFQATNLINKHKKAHNIKWNSKNHNIKVPILFYQCNLSKSVWIIHLKLKFTLCKLKNPINLKTIQKLHKVIKIMKSKWLINQKYKYLKNKRQLKLQLSVMEDNSYNLYIKNSRYKFKCLLKITKILNHKKVHLLLKHSDRLQ